MKIGLIGVLAVALLGGCQSGSGSAAPASSGSGGDEAQAGGQLIGTDPCAVELQNISGAMLFYYATRHAMPDRLEDLAPYADAGSPLKFTCPKSGLPYVYNANGLISGGRSKRIIVYDAQPVHGGARWCILAAPRSGNSSINLEVLLVPEDVFKTYSPGVLPY